ncbi:glycosyl transferase family 1 [Microvirga vignae]|uniref:Glycosyl transferase family 1 n=1 Tax=Microvirga vignae TaxID=1225564 RepID=A0A0H1RHE2_9HYPH|nr:glycosyltransferase family 4 protein [Microvirga vignae]KLK94479.1 glycosyl transferase family 1 [Microvirga vignae]
MSVSAQGASSLRVLMTADAVGGVWQYALDVAEGLRTYGVETTLVVLGPAPSDDQIKRAETAGVDLITTRLPLDWTAERPQEVEEAGRAIVHISAQIKPDIVHLNSPALAASGQHGCPVVAICHSCVATWWEAVRGGSLPEEFVWRADLVRKGYHAADKLLAPTAAFADATARTYNLAVAPTVVRNGRRAIAAGDCVPCDVFVFTAGRLWDDGKNFAAIDRAAARLSLPTLAAGPLKGPNGTQVEAHYAISLGRLSDDEIAQYLSAQPIFVSVAKYEPFGLAVLEAAQAGCALVLSDIPTFRELWDGEAVFVDPDDDQALAQAIEHLASDDATCRELGEAARKRAAAYSVEAMSAGVLEAYRSLLPSRFELVSLNGAAA